MDTETRDRQGAHRRFSALRLALEHLLTAADGAAVRLGSEHQYRLQRVAHCGAYGKALRILKRVRDGLRYIHRRGCGTFTATTS